MVILANPAPKVPVLLESAIPQQGLFEDKTISLELHLDHPVEWICRLRYYAPQNVFSA